MPVAYVYLPQAAHYRADAFVAGFKRLGFRVRQEQPSTTLGPDDVALVWNMTARSRQSIELCRKGGGTLIVAENGYYGVDQNGRQGYALAVSGHNGSGRWFAPDDSRLKALNIDFQPWRFRKGGTILVAEQRGIGSALMRSPPRFAHTIADQMRPKLGCPVRVRPHPGRHAPDRTLEADLKGSDALVVWSSNCATQALIAGIPTFYRAPTIVTAGAAKPYADIYRDRFGFTDEARQEAFARMAWAQWFLDEIETGEPMKTLVDVRHGRLPAVGEGLPQ